MQAPRERLGLNDSVLSCQYGLPSWSVSVRDLILVAEYTTNEGPYLDDYFLVFVTIQDGKPVFSTCSFYADGRDEVCRTLRQQFGITVEFGLLQSTEWSSRVTWPERLAGEDYFKFNLCPPTTVREKLSNAVFGPSFEYGVALRVREYIEQAGCPRS